VYSQHLKWIKKVNPKS